MINLVFCQGEFIYNALGIALVIWEKPQDKKEKNNSVNNIYNLKHIWNLKKNYECLLIWNLSENKADFQSDEGSLLNFV